MCSPSAELHDRSTLGSSDDAVRLCGNQTLVIDDQQKHGLYKLRLNYGSLYGQNWFMWENGSSFWYSPDVTSKFKISQIFEKAVTKNTFAPEKVNVLRCKMKGLQVLYCLLYPCHNSIASAIGNFSEEHVKIGDVFDNT